MQGRRLRAGPPVHWNAATKSRIKAAVRTSHPRHRTQSRKPVSPLRSKPGFLRQQEVRSVTDQAKGDRYKRE
jgi:hypothetical protein